MIDFHKIYNMGFATGYRATACKTVVTCPYSAGTDLAEHWQDGYDLGVLAALQDDSADNDNYRMELIEFLEAV